MNTLLRVQILVCRDNDGIVAGSANDRAGGEEGGQGHGQGHSHVLDPTPTHNNVTPYCFLADFFFFFLILNEACLLTLSSSAPTTAQSTAVLWRFNGTAPPSSSLQQSATRRWKVLLLYWVILLLFLVQWPTSSHLSIWRPNRQTKHSCVALFVVLPSSFRQPN